MSRYTLGRQTRTTEIPHRTLHSLNPPISINLRLRIRPQQKHLQQILVAPVNFPSQGWGRGLPHNTNPVLHSKKCHPQLTRQNQYSQAEHSSLESHSLSEVSQVATMLLSPNISA